MKQYYVTEKAYISTLTGIIYTGMYSYGDANLQRYIFEQEPTKTTKTSRQVLWIFTTINILYWLATHGFSMV